VKESVSIFTRNIIRTSRYHAAQILPLADDDDDDDNDDYLGLISHALCRFPAVCEGVFIRKLTAYADARIMRFRKFRIKTALLHASATLTNDVT